MLKSRKSKERSNSELNDDFVQELTEEFSL